MRGVRVLDRARPEEEHILVIYLSIFYFLPERCEPAVFRLCGCSLEVLT